MHLDGHASSIHFSERLTVGAVFAFNLVHAHGVKFTFLAAVLVAAVLADVCSTAPLLAVALGPIVLAEHGAAAISALVLDAPVRADSGATAIATMLLEPVVFAVRRATLPAPFRKTITKTRAQEQGRRV